MISKLSEHFQRYRAATSNTTGAIDKILDQIIGGRSDANLRFDDLRRVLLALGFQERIKGSHHILWREGVDEILNIQPLPGGKARVY